MMNFVTGWDPIVPFQQRGGVADQLEGVGIHLPHRVEHRMIVRVEKVLFELRVTGDMNLPNAMMRNVVEIIVGIEVVVLRRDVNVVYVQEHSAVGQLDHFTQEFPLRHF